VGENQTVVRVEGLWKKYCKSLRRSAFYTLADAARGALGVPARSYRLRKQEFWALRDINLELKRGECLGVIGPNGAGKTTLLKALSGLIEPDRGRVEVRGRVGELIQLGAGFHPQLTGRENIHVNASILGMSPREIRRKFDAIVEFADIGEFLDSPVKFYSSGMLVRLGFAIAVHMEPELLLVDEVLSVGDVAFRLKCLDRVKELARNGLSMVFVSHNMNPVRAYCDRVVLLDRGRRVTGPDDPETVLQEAQLIFARGRRSPAAGAPRWVRPDAPVEIRAVELLDSDGRARDAFSYDEHFRVRVSYSARRRIEDPVLGLEIKASDDRVCIMIWSSHYHVHFDPLEGEGAMEVAIDGLLLAPGYYAGRVVIADSTVSVPIVEEGLPRFAVRCSMPYSGRGVFFPRASWRGEQACGRRPCNWKTPKE